MTKTNMIGKRFGRLVIIEKIINKSGPKIYKCRCDCGKEINVRLTSLKTGNSKSCGCLRRDSLLIANTKHGFSKIGQIKGEYRSYYAMKNRCYNPDAVGYNQYGGIGIKVCERWLESFNNFIEDMGLKPSPLHTLDRYPDVNGNYEPGNCRWATKKEQGNNRRNTKYVIYEGEKVPLAVLAQKMGFNYDLVNRRLRIGWDLMTAINTPKKYSRIHLYNKKQ
jgi:hypothetical protein